MPTFSAPPLATPSATSNRAPLATALPTRTPPGPRGHWLLGHLHEYRTGRLHFLEHLRGTYGPISSYRLGPRRFVLVSEPDVIEQVYVHRNREFSKFYITRMAREVFGDGLLTSSGEHWLRQRRLIQPTFAQQQLAAFGSAMVGQTCDLMQHWQPGQERDLLREMQHVTMAIAAETLLGVRLSDEVQEIEEPHNLIRADFDRRVESLFTIPPWIPTRYNRSVRAAKATICGIVDRLIEHRRTAREPGPDMLSKLLAARGPDGERMSPIQVRDESLTFLFAGHETTASALAWTWYLLAKHPEVEAKLHRELDEVLAGRLPTVADVPRLTYTAKVFRETLRLYPSAYGNGRQALRTMELGGFRIEAGTNVILSQWLTHRDGRFFERPLEFAPDRWTPEFERSLPHYAYFPFGGGPRVCIGNNFAQLEAALLIATIASRYRMRLVPGQNVQPVASLTLRPGPSLRMICERRPSIPATT
jgi:cytochrome P450